MQPAVLACPRLPDSQADKGERGGNEIRELRANCTGDLQTAAKAFGCYSERSGGTFADNVSTYLTGLFWGLNEIIRPCLAQCLAHRRRHEYSYYLLFFRTKGEWYRLGEEKGKRNCGVPLAGLCLLSNVEGGVAVQWRSCGGVAKAWQCCNDEHCLPQSSLRGECLKTGWDHAWKVLCAPEEKDGPHI